MVDYKRLSLKEIYTPGSCGYEDRKSMRATVRSLHEINTAGERRECQVDWSMACDLKRKFEGITDLNELNKLLRDNSDFDERRALRSIIRAVKDRLNATSSLWEGDKGQGHKEYYSTNATMTTPVDNQSDLNEEEEQLRYLLHETSDYEEKKKIRASIRDLRKKKGNNRRSEAMPAEMDNDCAPVAAYHCSTMLPSNCAFTDETVSDKKRFNGEVIRLTSEPPAAPAAVTKAPKPSSLPLTADSESLAAGRVAAASDNASVSSPVQTMCGTLIKKCEPARDGMLPAAPSVDELQGADLTPAMPQLQLDKGRDGRKEQEAQPSPLASLVVTDCFAPDVTKIPDVLPESDGCLTADACYDESEAVTKGLSAVEDNRLLHQAADSKDGGCGQSLTAVLPEETDEPRPILTAASNLSCSADAASGIEQKPRCMVTGVIIPSPSAADVCSNDDQMSRPIASLVAPLTCALADVENDGKAVTKRTVSTAAALWHTGKTVRLPVEASPQNQKVSTAGSTKHFASVEDRTSSSELSTTSDAKLRRSQGDSAETSGPKSKSSLVRLHSERINAANRLPPSPLNGGHQPTIGRVSSMRIVSRRKALKIATPLCDMKATDGDRLSLVITLYDAGDSASATWYKDGRQLQHSKEIAQSISKDSCRLDFEEVFPDDAGLYRCIVQNEFGQDETSARLTIQNNPLWRSPEFITGLKDTVATLGRSLELRVQVHAIPDPVLLWYLGKEILDDGDDFEQRFDGSVGLLVIKEVLKGDSGLYRCVARNSVGQQETSCSVTLAAGSSRGITENKPKICKELCDVVYRDGDTGAALSCSLSEKALAIEVTWYKDSKVLRNSSDVRQMFDGIVAKLVFNEIYPDDAGLYKCSLKIGDTDLVTSARLTVPELKEELPELRSSPTATKTPKSLELLPPTPTFSVNAESVIGISLPARAAPCNTTNDGSGSNAVAMAATVQASGARPWGKLVASSPVGLALTLRRSCSDVLPSSKAILTVKNLCSAAEADTNNNNGLANITDEGELQKVLDSTQDYETRKRIRARIREVKELKRTERESERKRFDEERALEAKRKLAAAEDDKKRLLEKYDELSKSGGGVGVKALATDELAKRGLAAADSEKKQLLQDFQDKSKDSIGARVSKSEEMLKFKIAEAEQTKDAALRSFDKAAKDESEKMISSNKSTSTDVSDGLLKAASTKSESCVILKARQDATADKPLTTQTVQMMFAAPASRNETEIIIQDKQDKKEDKPLRAQIQVNVAASAQNETEIIVEDKPDSKEDKPYSTQIITLRASAPVTAVKEPPEMKETKPLNSPDGMKALGRVASMPGTQLSGGGKVAPSAARGAMAAFKQLDKSNNPNAQQCKPNIRSSPRKNVQIILDFIKANTAEYKISIDNYSTSWNNGMAFCALIHHFYPEAFDYNALDPKNRRYNFTLAFDVAEKYADISPLLDVEDMVRMEKPDWKCVFTYVQSFYRKLRNNDLNKHQYADN